MHARRDTGSVGIPRHRCGQQRARPGGDRSEPPPHYVVRGAARGHRDQSRWRRTRPVGLRCSTRGDSEPTHSRGPCEHERAGMIYGWDLGGAHVKVAVLDREGAVQRVAQAPCELWMGLEQLDAALASLAIGGTSGALHAVTMTGELADVFPDRASGVAAIAERFVKKAGTDTVRLFIGTGFIEASAARASWSQIASANWRASALFVARLAPDALLIDVGSTTTDITPIAAGKVAARGSDDYTRLACEELVYTGAVRTPLMALAQSVPFAGLRVGVMAEHFATTADLYRVSGELDAQFDQARTADGRSRSKADSLRRLARMIGCDVEQAPVREWERLAD